MKFNINKINYKTFDIYEENRLKPRCFFIPYQDEKLLREQDLLHERYNSDMVTILNGEWDFIYYDKVSKLNDVLDTDKVKWDKIMVPSSWQRTGYEKPFYLNTRYQFPLNPPHIPEDIPVGVYHRTIDIDNIDKKYIINFLGVISSIDLYVNGQHVGYGEGAHNPQEFDITNYLLKGANDILVVVYKWSNGSYLECQDMFRENGIFRDVLLYALDDCYINDYSLRREFTGKGYKLSVDIEVVGEDYSTEVYIYDRDKLIAKGNGKLNYEFDLDIKEWSAEIPYLYEVIIKLKRKDNLLNIIKDYIGFTNVVIDKNVFLINGQPIKIKGVNHHDTNPVTGYYMTPEQLLEDVMLMKEYNVNAVRTSHYPPDPLFLKLSDKYGLYVIDEADIEAHGCGECSSRNADLVSNDPLWVNHYLDRVKRMFYRDRNHASIIMWSLGNEAGGIYNQDRCYEWLKDVSHLPVHYEPACRKKRVHYDVASQMYSWHIVMRMIGKGLWGRKYREAPFFLCEYAHAMGIGPGGLEDYWKIIYKYDILMGGCIWEWADHAVFNHKGKYKYTYGGDHDEFIHDGNFCVDGLFYPDRRPHIGAYEMKAVYRPIRIINHNENVYDFRNTNYFLDSANILIEWSLMIDGEEIETGAINDIIKPQEVKSIYINHSKPVQDKDNIIIFRYIDKFTRKTIAAEQIELHTLKSNNYYNKETIKYKTDGNKLIVNYDKGEITFDIAIGKLVSYKVKGVEILNTSPIENIGITPNIYRAPIDNDKNMIDRWNKAGYDRAVSRLNKVKVIYKDNCITIRTNNSIYGGDKKLFNINITYEIFADGTIKVSNKYTNYRLTLPSLPKLGNTIELAREFDRVLYYGLGDRENLNDYREHSLTGIYSLMVKDMHEPNIKPQESGMRSDVRWLRITNKDNIGLEIKYQSKHLTMNANHYTTSQLSAWKHTEDMIESDTTYLQIDGYMRGAGSASCGPQPEKKYRISSLKPLFYNYIIRPYGE